MRVIVIGGSGHIGTYLIPRLVKAGHEVLNISRGKRIPYKQHLSWTEVKNIQIDRTAQERSETFGRHIADLKPDIVIDLICFSVKSASQLVEKLIDNVDHFLFCGSIWVHGHSVAVPTTEDQPRNPVGEYGIQKAAIEDYLLSKAKNHKFPATIIHPGHIVGPGWLPVNPAANLNTDVLVKLVKGNELLLPNIGLETIHHVHADDAAQIFAKAIENRNSSVGESFHAVSEKALTLRGAAEMLSSLFGKTPNLKYLPFYDWSKTVSKTDAETTWDHISHSPNCSIEKAKKYIGYKPGYTSMQAMYESVIWLIDNNIIDIS